MARGAHVETTLAQGEPVAFRFRTYRLKVLEGAEKGTVVQVTQRVARLGSDPDGTLALSDPTVSMAHAIIEVDVHGYRVDDVGSKNGTVLEGRRIVSAYLSPGDVLTLGQVRVRFELSRDEAEVELSTAWRCGGMVGRSRGMREIFSLLEKVAPSEATVLVEGETGTGKELVAEALHRLSGREGPLVVLDCSAVARELVESELFGHVKGAYTGAERERLGAFRAADGGTLFLDEMGELPESLQPKLLRALEKQEVRPVGSDRPVPVKVRVIAATNRSLAREVAEGRFRADLYYRLAVVRVRLPPLRERMEDLPLLVEAILGPDAARVSYSAMERLRKHHWPGNVRELKNFLQRAQAVAGGDLERAGPIEPMSGQESRVTSAGVDVMQPFKEAKQALVDDFERRYWAQLLERCQHNLSEAARIAGVHRKSAEYIVQKLGLRGREM
ncbi:sigma 54-interacting transcriptional regulator [Archangium lipolyticum]|uniref:sigma 54-interacting transcriptional regulator n=1 Tax=Archangium lipolyticum TaxID=2970465 RepID=UPI00214A62DE|nr:sigma 54-interacting transcriptional regulator [Archangium lipolyticum]